MERVDLNAWFDSGRLGRFAAIPAGWVNPLHLFLRLRHMTRRLVKGTPAASRLSGENGWRRTIARALQSAEPVANPVFPKSIFRTIRPLAGLFLGLSILPLMSPAAEPEPEVTVAPSVAEQGLQALVARQQELLATPGESGLA